MPWNTTSPGNGHGGASIFSHVYSRGHHNIVSTRGQRCTLNIFQETVLLGITPECLFPQTCLLMNLQFRRRLNRKSYERFLGTFWRWVKAPELAWTKICFSRTFLCHLPSRPTQALCSTELFNLSSPRKSGLFGMWVPPDNDLERELALWGGFSPAASGSSGQ